jgi:hypothetical protein
MNAVASVVVLAGRAQPDNNGFVTALGARALRRAGRAVPAAWLDTLERCARDDGAYGFWPVHETPAWAPRLPSDADDTAVMLLELLHSGRVTRAQAKRTAIRSLARQRVICFPEQGPVWRRRGAFRTWHRAGVDLVDCTVNANVLALLATLGLLHLPGVAESVQMISSALDWAADLPLRAASLSPFYPEPCELIGALEHAVECGAWALTAPLHRARATSWARAQVSDSVICSSPYGAIEWHSAELWQIRAACGRF